MPDTTTEYVLRAGGEIVRRDMTERNVIINENVINQLCTSVLSITSNVCRAAVQEGDIELVTLVTRGREVFASFPLHILNIRAPFRLLSGAMVPVFSSNVDPMLSLQWMAPPTMRLKALMQFKQEVIHPKRFLMLTMWLYAYDRDGACYRLPLPNLYEDCKVCTGDQKSQYVESMQKAVEYNMDLFRNSSWNADLWTTVDESQTLFGFVPEGEGANQIFKPRAVESWQSYCRKVATAYSVMVPL